MAERLGTGVRVLAYRLSSEVSGSPENVVGLAAAALP
jgi:hypothetical protein